jgi:hypothetical protein
VHLARSSSQAGLTQVGMAAVVVDEASP